jgi:cbb3-type cytochrome oxidase maturation protein
MNIIFISIPISLILVAIGVAAFFWAVRSGQFDDLDSPAYSILMDDDDQPRNKKKADQEDASAQDEESSPDNGNSNER